MGNAGSNTRERNVKGNETAPPSPTKEGQAFTFDKKKRRKGTLVGSHDDEGPVYTKQHQLPHQVKFKFIFIGKQIFPSKTLEKVTWSKLFGATCSKL